MTIRDLKPMVGNNCQKMTETASLSDSGKGSAININVGELNFILKHSIFSCLAYAGNLHRIYMTAPSSVQSPRLDFDDKNVP